MTGSIYIKQAIIASLCEHPDREKYRTRAFAGDSLTSMADALAGKGVALTKKDFFTADEAGVYLIDTPGFWRNFNTIRDMLAKQGEYFTSADFLFTFNTVPSRSLKDNATTHKALDKVFSHENWRGRYDEMELLWHKFTVPSRRDFTGGDGTIPLALKRILLPLENRAVAEDRLARSGLTVNDIHHAFRERGDFEALKRRLANGNDRLRKEYLLLTDAMGDTCFASQDVWQRYPEIARILAAHGEQLEVADFIRQVGQAGNILKRAAERNAIDKIFAPEIWANRLGDMLALWGYVLGGWKVPSITEAEANFDMAYATAESLTYTPVADLTKLHGRQDVLRPINEEDAQPVIALGLKSFWDQHAHVAIRQFAAQNDALKLSDLRRVSGQTGHTCLISAAKFGHFRTVIDIARASKEELQMQDFMLRDQHGNTLLSILAARKELSLVFTPEQWAGRIGDMKILWSQVRLSDRGQINMDQIEVATKQATLKKMNRKNNFKLG